ncbi:hypothetical protein JCM1841_000879 [Sporobolomyces salmonicolor]
MSRAAPRVPLVNQFSDSDTADLASPGVAEELSLASRLLKELAELDLGSGSNASFEDFVVGSPSRMLRARAEVTSSAVLMHHERQALVMHDNYQSVPDSRVADLLLAPDGDILVESAVTFTDSPVSNPILRLTAAYAIKIPRLSRLFYLLPAARPDTSHCYSLEVLQKRAQVLAVATSEKVVGYYGFIVWRYLEFCDNEQIPLPERFPISRQAALLFLSSLAGSLAADTIRTYFNGLRTWHVLHDLELDVPEAAWKLTYKGLKKSQPDAREPRPPATFVDLLAIRKHLDLTLGHDACIWAACCVAFWAMARPGDVTIAKLSAFDPKRDSTVSDVRFIPATHDFPEHVSIRLPFDKVQGAKGDFLILTNQSGKPELDPIVALRNHLTVNKPKSSNFLFSSLPWNGSRDHLVPLTGDYFRKKINEFLQKEHRPVIAGHSWRIGGATFYLLAGIHPDFIKKIGRWRSDAFLRYWRNIKVIAALNMQDAACVDIGETVESRNTYNAQ